MKLLVMKLTSLPPLSGTTALLCIINTHTHSLIYTNTVCVFAVWFYSQATQQVKS